MENVTLFVAVLFKFDVNYTSKCAIIREKQADNTVDVFYGMTAKRTNKQWRYISLSLFYIINING